MLQNTTGIVLKNTAFGDTGIISKIYTRDHGLRSFLIKGAKSKKNNKIAALQHLNLVEFSAYFKDSDALAVVKEIRNKPVYATLHQSMFKRAIGIYLNEILYLSLRHLAERDENLFDFVFNALQILDSEEGINQNFHLKFLLKLTRFLGFKPSGNFSESNHIFNLQEGVFEEHAPLHPYYLDKEFSAYLDHLLKSDLMEETPLKISNAKRRRLLSSIQLYFKLHISNFGEIHSTDILNEVFED